VSAAAPAWLTPLRAQAQRAPGQPRAPCSLSITDRLRGIRNRGEIGHSRLMDERHMLIIKSTGVPQLGRSQPSIPASP
jgi:hypothetical protein